MTFLLHYSLTTHRLLVGVHSVSENMSHTDVAQVTIPKEGKGDSSGRGGGILVATTFTSQTSPLVVQCSTISPSHSETLLQVISRIAVILSL